MRLSISNIAWQQDSEPEILEILKNNRVTGIEVAPTKIWQGWEGASYKGAIRYKNLMKERGFDLPAIQAILFGKPELQLFDKSSHRAMLEHMRLVVDIANGFDSKVIVFGAPKNRRRLQMPYADAVEVASEFFYKVSEICNDSGCSIGLEHNPVEYGCDFLTNVKDAKELVEKVNHRNFRLHLDAAGIHMCGGSISEIISNAGKFVHYHISEPMLEPISGGVVDHKSAIDTLNSIDYKAWVSIEMKQPTSIDLLEKSLHVVNKIIFKP
jgi:sugar phosphate isomerase/epimerase